MFLRSFPFFFIIWTLFCITNCAEEAPRIRKFNPVSHLKLYDKDSSDRLIYQSLEELENIDLGIIELDDYNPESDSPVYKFLKDSILTMIDLATTGNSSKELPEFFYGTTLKLQRKTSFHGGTGYRLYAFIGDISMYFGDMIVRNFSGRYEFDGMLTVGKKVREFAASVERLQPAQLDEFMRKAKANVSTDPIVKFKEIEKKEVAFVDWSNPTEVRLAIQLRFRVYGPNDCVYWPKVLIDSKTGEILDAYDQYHFGTKDKC